MRKVLSRMASAAVTDGVKDGTFAVIAATVSIAKDVVTEDTAYKPPFPSSRKEVEMW